MVDTDRFANAGVSAKLHSVDVVNEVRAVEIACCLEVTARADPLERAPRLGALLFLVDCPDRRFHLARNPFLPDSRSRRLLGVRVGREEKPALLETQALTFEPFLQKSLHASRPSDQGLHLRELLVRK